MIYLRLFLNFLMIGALSFGGGYGMVVVPMSGEMTTAVPSIANAGTW